jgi:two-component system cell cycle sensor histidine kinase/response regulator CckA
LAHRGDSIIRADKARSKAETRSRELPAIVTSFDAAIVRSDLAGSVVAWNESAEDLYGYTAQEMIGQPMATIIPERLHEESLRVLEAIVAGKSLARYETVRRRKEGSLIQVSLVVSPVKDSQGAIVGASTIAREIIDRKHREECERLAAVVESSDDAIIGKTLEGTITAWNPGAENLFGYATSEAVGKQIEMLLPPERINEESEILERIRNGQRVKHFETVRVRKDGTKVDVSVTISPIRDRSGAIMGASEISRDITERMRAEELGERLAAVVESCEDAIIGKSLDGTITDWNPGAENLFGYLASEAMGKPIEMLLPPERANEESEILARISRGERLEHFETVRLQKDGKRVDVSVSISPIRDRSGLIVGASKIARDISERKCAEEELRKSEERFSKAFRQSPLAIVISTEEDERYLDVNDSFLSMVGCERGRVIGHTASELMFWAQPSLRIDLLRQLRAGGKMTDVRVQFRTSTAEVRDAELTWEPIEVEGQSCLLAFIRDITEQMRSEKSLREYERVVEGLEDMIVVVDRDYRYIIANRAFLNYRDMESAHVIGHRVDEVLEKDTYEAIVKEKMDECFEGKVVQYELKFSYPKLGERALLVSYFPIAGPTGIERIACVLRDVTERKRAEEELRKSEDRFSKAFRQSPLAITISTEADGMYLDANESFLKMTGYTREDVVGRTASEMRFWALPSLRADLLQELREGDKVTGRRMEFKTSTAETREAEMSWEEIEVEGQPCLLAFMRDITETQRLEAQFLQAQKMEAVGRLAGGVAHDFNNMLSVIIGYSDLSVDLVASDSPVRRHLAQIKKASERAALLTRQLLAFSRQQVIFPRILNLNEVVNNVITMLLRMVSESISVSFRPTTPIGSIKADPGQIEQILMNLVVNARDAMPRGGEIVIETAHAELDEHYVSEHPGSQTGRHVILAVSDNGCGIEEAIKCKIFEPFFTTKGIGQGTGLGLSTVYGIVSQSKGSICVDSEVGKGTKFTIYFPRIAAEAEELAQTPEVDDVISGTETILLVEDDASVRKVTSSLLSSAGYRVIEASNAEKALEIIRSLGQGIDLLLTDLIMFGQSGFDLYEQAKVIRPGLRSLFMSGYTGDLIALQGGLISERAFLPKPFTRISLLKKVHSALHSE